MRFKLDEILGIRSRELLCSAGHDVATALEEGLQGARDDAVFAACKSEGRTLITLDHDFGNVLRFPPQGSHGIVILELPPHSPPDALLDRVREFLRVLASRPLGSELWIVEPGRVRVHEPSS